MASGLGEDSENEQGTRNKEQEEGFVGCPVVDRTLPKRSLGWDPPTCAHAWEDGLITGNKVIV